MSFKKFLSLGASLPSSGWEDVSTDEEIDEENYVYRYRITEKGRKLLESGHLEEDLARLISGLPIEK